LFPSLLALREERPLVAAGCILLDAAEYRWRTYAPDVAQVDSWVLTELHVG
jgi:hypothetical protein